MQPHLDQLIQCFEQITQHLKRLELVFTQARPKDYITTNFTELLSVEANPSASSPPESSID